RLDRTGQYGNHRHGPAHDHEEVLGHHLGKIASQSSPPAEVSWKRRALVSPNCTAPNHNPNYDFMPMATEEHRLVAGLLNAYRSGCFPMADPEGRAGVPGAMVWLNPDPRGIIPLTEGEGLHIPRRVRDRVRSGRFTITSDAAFEDVIEGCALPRPSEKETWIDDRILGAYSVMHRAGHAHSVEAWLPET